MHCLHRPNPPPPLPAPPRLSSLMLKVALSLPSEAKIASNDGMYVEEKEHIFCIGLI